MTRHDFPDGTIEYAPTLSLNAGPWAVCICQDGQHRTVSLLADDVDGHPMVRVYTDRTLAEKGRSNADPGHGAHIVIRPTDGAHAVSEAYMQARDDVVQAAVAFAATTEHDAQMDAGARLRDVVYRMQGVGR